MTDQATGENASNPSENGGNTEVSRDVKGRFSPGQSATPSKVFTSGNQPPGTAKSLGKQKKKASREALLELLSMKIDLDAMPQVRDELIQVFGKKALKKASAYEISAMRQMVKALKANDTQAFMALSNQTFGTLQKMEHSGPGGKAIGMDFNGKVTTRVVVVKNPHASEQAQ
jgi:hypothetical protein